MSESRLPPQIIQQLQTIVGETHLSLTEAERKLHARDQSPVPGVLPDVVIWPANTQEVSAIARLANEHRIPLVGWGAGTSLEGNPIPVRHGIVLDFRRMNKIIAVHDQDFQVTTQPGILYKDMNQELASYGLFFAPDPGANASVGGMIANNAAGIRTVKYGATRDNVLGLEVVLANGTILRTGSRSIKQSAGYDLTHLFTGSEGTLGLVTEATLKLAPRPEHVSAATAAFASVTDAAEAVFGIIGSGLIPAALELLDRTTIEIIREKAGLELVIAPTLLMEFSGASETALEIDLDLVRSVCQECECIRFEAGMGAEARNRLWETRHQLLEIMVRTFPGYEKSTTDVAVPISRLPLLVSYIAETIAELGLTSFIAGHAGDGNVHTITLFAPDDTLSRQNSTTLNKRLVSKALELGGTCTGEHGVGLLKQQYMEQEHGVEAMIVMRQLKALFDPHDILNPGKVVG